LDLLTIILAWNILGLSSAARKNLYCQKKVNPKGELEIIDS